MLDRVVDGGVETEWPLTEPTVIDDVFITGCDVEV